MLQYRHHASGFALGLTSALMMGAMATTVNRSLALSPSLLAFYRGVIGLIIVIPLCRSEIRRLFSPSALQLWIFGVAGAISINMFFWNLKHSTIGTACALFNLAPLFTTLLLRLRGSVLYYREVQGLAAITVGTMLLHWSTLSPPSAIVFLVGAGGALSAAIAYNALSNAVFLGSSILPLVPLNISTAIISFTAGITTWVAVRGASALILALVGVLGTAGHFLMARSFRSVSTMVGTALATTSLLWGALFGSLFGARPGFLDWCAYVLVASGVVLLRMR